MGLDRSILKRSWKLRRNGILPGKFSVAEIGVQQLGDGVTARSQSAAGLCRRLRRSLAATSAAPLPQTRTSRIELLREDAPFMKDFRSGSAVTAWRPTSTLAPHTIRLDLNFDDVPGRAQGQVPAGDELRHDRASPANQN